MTWNSVFLWAVQLHRTCTQSLSVTTRKHAARLDARSTRYCQRGWADADSGSGFGRVFDCSTFCFASRCRESRSRSSRKRAGRRDNTGARTASCEVDFKAPVQPNMRAHEGMFFSWRFFYAFVFPSHRAYLSASKGKLRVIHQKKMQGLLLGYYIRSICSVIGYCICAELCLPALQLRRLIFFSGPSTNRLCCACAYPPTAQAGRLNI